MANKTSSTQQNIPIAGIKDGVVLTKDGGYRVILSVAALNYALKSEQEQNALIFQYQSFLNSLHFPIQIVMQSKRLDLAPYLRKIKDASDKQSNELLRGQTVDYIDFVSQLVNMANIMKKSFYVVISYQPLMAHNNNFLDKFFKHQESQNLKISETEYNHYRDELLERANVVAGGLGTMGLHCVQMNTEEIIELFYKIYNPDVYSKERINDVNTLTNPFVASKPEETNPDSKEENSEQEDLIDNSSIVRERQKEEFKQKQREEDKNAEKAGVKYVQTAPTEAKPVAAAPVAAQAVNQAPVENQTPAPVEQPQPIDQSNNFGV